MCLIFRQLNEDSVAMNTEEAHMYRRRCIESVFSKVRVCC